MSFWVRFYTDITRYHETSPCELHHKVYPTADLAESAARAELAAVRQRHGATAGYAIFADSTHDQAVNIGPVVRDGG